MQKNIHSLFSSSGANIQMGLPSPMTHKTSLPLLSLCGHLNVKLAIFFLFYSQAHFKMPVKITVQTVLIWGESDGH